MPTVNLSNSHTSHPSGDMVRTYLQEIGRVPLLTHEQEILFGKQVQQLMVLLAIQEQLHQTTGRLPSLSEWAEAAHLCPQELDRTLRVGQRAKRRMIEANLRLVVAIAKKYQKRNMEFLDLIQEGSLGLERGVEKFDPTKGYKFSTYAYWWIRQAITRAIAQQSRSIRLPIHITEKLNKIKRAQRELSQKLGRSATIGEIAETLELETAQVREFLTIGRKPISLDIKVGDNHDTELLELLEDGQQGSEGFMDQEWLRQDLKTLLEQLTPQQQEIIRLRYGLVDGKEHSLSGIGRLLNMSRERVRQLERQALTLLRKQRHQVKEYIAS